MSLVETPQLPTEIIHHIIECLIPSSNPIAISASHPVTKTLLSLARTSRLTYPTSIRLLYSHCVYIDTFSRLRCFKDALFRAVWRMNGDHPNWPNRDFHTPLLNHITSIYMCPFAEDRVRDIHQLYQICDILDLVAISLKRLVLRLPVDVTMIQDLEGNPGSIRQSFLNLTSLEVFCSVHFPLLIMFTGKNGYFVEDHAWKGWPRLRVMALLDTAPDEQKIWEGWGAMEGLERLIVSQCKVDHGYNIQTISEQELQCLWKESQKHRAVKRSMELVIVSAHVNAVFGEESWEEHSLQISRCDLVLGDDRSIGAKLAAYERQVVERILDGYETPGC